MPFLNLGGRLEEAIDLASLNSLKFREFLVRSNGLKNHVLHPSRKSLKNKVLSNFQLGVKLYVTRHSTTFYMSM